MAIDPALLDILADPRDKGALLPVPGEDALYNPRLRLRYAVHDGIPVLLAGDILSVDEAEHGRIIAKIGPTTVAARVAAAPRDVAVTKPVSQYEGHATWYDATMDDPADRGGLAGAGFGILSELLGAGSGIALNIGCGTGRAAAVLRGLGYRPLGVDLAADQLRLAAARLPVVQGTAHELPIASGSVPLAYSTFTTASWGDLGLSLREIHRVLSPGGRFASVGVHLCFNGGYSVALPDGSVKTREGYRTSGYLPPSHFSGTVRSRVGGWHWPLAELFNAVIDAGFRLTRVIEGGARSVPTVLGIAAVKP
jgi:uncharacterized protein YbaR (Trm112 family)/SAM-dependent methyltransferase